MDQCKHTKVAASGYCRGCEEYVPSHRAPITQLDAFAAKAKREGRITYHVSEFNLTPEEAVTVFGSDEARARGWRYSNTAGLHSVIVGS